MGLPKQNAETGKILSHSSGISPANQFKMNLQGFWDFMGLFWIRTSSSFLKLFTVFRENKIIIYKE